MPKVAKPFMIGKAITSVAAKTAKKYIRMGKSFWKDGEGQKPVDDTTDKTDNSGTTTRRKSKKISCKIYTYLRNQSRV